MRTLVSLFLAVASLSAAAELGPARRIVPPDPMVVRAPWPVAASPDGHVLLAATQTLRVSPSYAATFHFAVVDGEGSQLRDAVLSPVTLHSAHWAGHFFVFEGDRYVRIATDGTLLDGTPRVLPAEPLFLAASDARVLAVTASGAWFIDPDGTATPVSLAIPGTIRGIASDGQDFVIKYSRATINQHLRVIDDHGVLVRDRKIDDMGDDAFVGSDGTTWIVHDKAGPGSGGSDVILDGEFNVVRRRFHAGVGHLAPMPRRGYLAVTPTSAVEMLAPSYNARTIPLQPTAITAAAAFGESLFVRTGRPDVAPTGTHLIRSFDQVGALPPALEFDSLPPLRVDPQVAANGAGVSLLVWWQGDDFRRDLLAARLDSHGRMLDASPLVLDEGCSPANYPKVAVASDGDGFLAVWTSCESLGLRGATVTSGGTATRVVDTSIGRVFTPRVVFDGTDYAVSWSEGSSAEDSMLARFSPGGSSLRNYRPVDGMTTHFAMRQGGGFLLIGYTNMFDAVVHMVQRTNAAFDPQGPISTILPQDLYIETLQRAGDRFLVEAITQVGDRMVMWLDRDGHKMSSLDSHGTLVPRNSRIFCAAECTLIRRDDANRFVAATVTADGAGRVVVGASRVVASDDVLPSVGDAFHFAGTAAEPTRMLRTGIDPERFGATFLAHAPPPVRRRTVRP
jgi:hypothetical protein